MLGVGGGGVLGSFFVGWSFVGLCLWLRYPVSVVGVDCAHADAMKCIHIEQ
jgi:hypothetical protein